MSFNENLKNELSYLDLTVKQLASMSGINKNTLNNYLTRNQMPSIEAGAKIANALGVTVEYLVFGEAKRENDKLRLINRLASKLTEEQQEYLIETIKLLMLKKNPA